MLHHVIGCNKKIQIFLKKYLTKGKECVNMNKLSFGGVFERGIVRGVKEKIKIILKKYLTKPRDGGIISIRCPLLEAARKRTLRIKQCRLLKSFGLGCLYFCDEINAESGD